MGLLNPSSKTASSVSLIISKAVGWMACWKQMQMVRQAMVLDLVDRAKDAGFQQIVVVTSYPELASDCSSPG